jgi:DNA-3-methyladenine glycosylase II
MKKIIDHFKQNDPILAKVVLRLEELSLLKPKGVDEYFEALTSNIIGQQLSGKVADVIFARFTKLFENQQITPKAVLSLTHQELRDTGMSNSKAKFLKDLAEKVSTGELNLHTLHDLDNESVIKELTRVKGIGPWTSEMFLIFTLGREDVFSHGDLGLKNAIKKLYNLEDPTREQVEGLSLKWSPYRSYACRILWKSLEFKD